MIFDRLMVITRGGDTQLEGRKRPTNLVKRGDRGGQAPIVTSAPAVGDE